MQSWRATAETTSGDRLAAIKDTATNTYLVALDDEDKAAAKLHIQQAAQAAYDARQQTLERHNGPVVANLTASELEHPSSVSQEDGDCMDFSAPRQSRLSAPHLQEQLSLFSDTTEASEEHTPLQGSLAAGYKERRLVPHACLPRMALATWTHVREVS